MEYDDPAPVEEGGRRVSIISLVTGALLTALVIAGALLLWTQTT